MKLNFKLILIIVLSIFLIILLGYFSYNIFSHYSSFDNLSNSKIFINDTSAKVTKYAIYGTHLNIEGNLTLNDKINTENSKFKMVIINKNSKEIDIPLFTDLKNNKLYFYTSKTINQGIYLDSLIENNYYIYIKITDKVSGLSAYYNLKNYTEYWDLEYYTITRNNNNNKIDIKWNENTLQLISKETKLPNNYYDIVIDQGHGGKSTGAMYNGYTESLLTYNIGKKLQKNLEKLGLKVLTTRNDIDETIEDYGENGRTVIPNKVKAKYCFSIHLNASDINSDATGVEIYCPSNADLTLGKTLSDKIMEMTNSNISPNNYGRYSKGVYVLTFNKEVIDECSKEAIDDGYTPYDIDLDTPLFFMIREVGGISTKAYTDGRNEKVGKNIYYNSNQTAEGYLLELGYMSNKDEITKIVSNEDKYVKAISDSIKEYLKLN